MLEAVIVSRTDHFTKMQLAPMNMHLVSLSGMEYRGSSVIRPAGKFVQTEHDL